MHMRILKVVLALLCSAGIYAESPSSRANTPATKDLSESIKCKKNRPVQLRFAGLELESDKNSVKYDFQLSASVLLHKDIAPLRSNMRNVTGNNVAGYRLLPSGEHFSRSATIRIGYSKSLLPRNCKPEDIYTYYYDSITGQWARLERISVDTIHLQVISRTTHFTDFINAVIRTPEMPEVSAFVPTQLTDVPAPSPLLNVPMVQEPEANPYGNATLVYPITLPAGRNGLHPNADLTYSSANGDGILGYGWSMPSPAITIDTRWGVPRYDSNYESEIYTLDGEQLVMEDENKDLRLPYQNHKQILRWGETTRFIVRNIKNNDVVTRYGTNPTNYWWKVTRSNGTTLYYGKYADGDTLANVLRDANGNIGYWALCEIEDLSGNYMTYEYEKDVIHNQIYLTSIRYTGHRGNGGIDHQPVYSVVFGYRDDDSYMTDGRLGFIRTTDKRVCYINITHVPESPYEPASVRRYDFEYANTANHKCIIQYIIHGRDLGVGGHVNPAFLIGNTICSRCDDHPILMPDTVIFSYYEQNLSDLFSSQEDTIRDLHNGSDKNSLDQSVSKHWNLGGTVAVGFGFSPWQTNFSVGGNYNYSESVGRTLYQLLDIDGDGLADKVYCSHDSILYRKHIIDYNGKHYFTAAQFTGIISSNLSKENSKSNNFGLQAGAEPIVSFSGGWSSTDSYTNCYFADVNADGLPDFIDNGTVHFNRINSSSGDFLQHNGINPKIDVNPDICETYFYYDGEVELDPKCYLDTVVVDSFTIVLPESHSSSSDCNVICEHYLCDGDDSYKELCEECVRQGETISLGCDSTAFADCIECYILYGDDYEKYHACADTMCTFAGQEMICDVCRVICESSSPALCNQCIYENCVAMLDNEGHCLIDENDPEDRQNDVCEECCEECQNQGVYSEECNRCKHRNHCTGVIPHDFLGQFESIIYDSDLYSVIQDMMNEHVICPECLITCQENPARCIPCMHRHCYYTDMTYLIDEMASDSIERIRQTYPEAKFFNRGNTWYAYQTETVCPEEDLISPNVDAVRVWVAPRNGVVDLLSAIQLIQENSTARQQSRTADGVRCIIQHNRGIDTTSHTDRLGAGSVKLIDIVTIPATDYGVHTKTYSSIPVQAGDVFFFHLKSRASHSFDNVNWEQTFEYNNSAGAYSSVNDYTCSGKDVFCPDTALGTIQIRFNASVLSSSLAVLTVNRIDTNHYVTNLHTETISEATLPLPDYTITNLQPDQSYFITLSGNDLGQIELKPRFTHIRSSESGNGNDTIISYLAPRLQFTPEITLDSTYYDLFGPLYKGWGQFAINNITSSDTIILDSLYNSSMRQANNMQGMTKDDFTASLQSFDTAAIIHQGNLEGMFRDRGLFYPLDSSCLWIEMKADAKNYRWEAYGRVARNGRALLSNTRDRAASVSYFTDSVADMSEWETYDNVVPVTNEPYRRITTIRKKSNSTQWNVSVGLGGGAFGFGASVSKGTYKLCADYMDMNGDRFPDIIQELSIQYTQPWGGLGKAIRKDNTQLYKTNQLAEGRSFSGTIPLIFSIPGNNPKSNKFASSTSGKIGVGTTNTNSTVLSAIRDVNGDGLPDKLYVSGNLVYVHLNIGYDFKPVGFVPLNNLGLSHSTCANVNASTQWSKFQLSLSVGASCSQSGNEAKSQLMDIDGDGMIDVISLDNNMLKIKPSVFCIPRNQTNIADINHLQYSETYNAGLDLAGTGGFTLFFIKFCAGLNGSPLTRSETKSTNELADMNGDGLPDLVRSDANGIYVRYNQMGKDGILKSVTNPTGNRIDLKYRLSEPTSRQPQRQWLLDSVINSDVHAPVGGNYMARHYIYSDPFYNTPERISHGYGCVTTEDLDRQTDGSYAVYRKHIRHYNNHDFAERGKLIADSLVDAEGHPYTVYEIGTIYVDAAGNETNDLCQDTKIKVGHEAHYTRYYEGGSNPIVTAKQYDYDRYYNVIRYKNFGDTAVHDDDLVADIAYSSANSGFNKLHNLVSLPATVSVSANNTPVRLTKAFYQNGRLAEYCLVDPDNISDSIATSYLYDEYGLLSSVITPPNYNEERMHYRIQYDNYSHSLPVMVADTFGSSSTIYSPMWQLPLSSTDAAGKTIRYTYDGLGRIASISAPVEDSLGIHTITYSYHPLIAPSHYNDANNTNNTSYVDVKAYMAGEDSTHSRLFYDARGREIQRLDRRGNKWLVKNISSVDNFGRTLEIYSPYFVPFSSDSSSFLGIGNLLEHQEYDILDRSLRLQRGDGSTISTNYTIGTDSYNVRRLLQERTDENSYVWKSYTDPYNRPTTSVSPEMAVTSFRYDPLGQLLSTTDPDGLSTTYRYDAFGRKAERVHPDAGTTQWTYDHAGNMVASATQRQINNDEYTSYVYNFNRLTNVMYPQNSYNNVQYTYDAAGRVTRRTDGTGYENFTYDALGNIASSERLIALPNEDNPYTFTTRYTYDSFGKMRQIVYPDGEVVDYRYQDGMLKSVAGYQPQFLDSNRYILSMAYDEYDRPLSCKYGNNDSTTYEYDPIRQWLTRVQLQNADNYVLKDASYSYDGVGNIISVDQTASSVGMGGTWHTDYMYDWQNRLTGAFQWSADLGDYTYFISYSPAGRLGYKWTDANYYLNYGYKANLNAELQNHQIAVFRNEVSDETIGLKWDADGQLTHLYNPCSDIMRQHLWTEAGQIAASVDNNFCAFYGYDGNGERAYKLTGHSYISPLTDEEWHADTYFDMDRVIYVNPYMVVSMEGYTKHYYNGSQRIASMVGDPSWLPSGTIVQGGGDAYVYRAQDMFETQMNLYNQYEEPSTDEHLIMDINGDIGGAIQLECQVDKQITSIDHYYLYPNILYNSLNNVNPNITPDIYFHHPDHLGSATWTTNVDGIPIQYLHYMPYGETFVDQSDVPYRERFRFTGKERDEETNYDYFGARYYASAFTSWLSVDPLSDKYPDVSPYAYCSWNPVKYVDPDGREKIISLVPTAKSTPAIKNAIAAFPENSNVIHVWAHGYNNGIQTYNSQTGKHEMITSPESMNAFLMDQSEIWQNREISDPSIVVLHSCLTGEGKGSIAEKISKGKIFENVIIVAPSKEVVVTDGIEYGPTDKNNLENIGEWKMFLDGKVVNAFSGKTPPVFDNPKQQVERYKNKMNE